MARSAGSKSGGASAGGSMIPTVLPSNLTVTIKLDYFHSLIHPMYK